MTGAALESDEALLEVLPDGDRAEGIAPAVADLRALVHELGAARDGLPAVAKVALSALRYTDGYVIVTLEAARMPGGEVSAHAAAAILRVIDRIWSEIHAPFCATLMVHRGSGLYTVIDGPRVKAVDGIEL